MPLKNYGVWVGTPTKFNSPPKDDDTPHLDLRFKDDEGSYFANINVKSGNPENSNLVFWIVDPLPESLTLPLSSLKHGFHPISADSKLGLDFLSGDYFDITKGRILGFVPPGSQTIAPTILSTLEPILKQAITERNTIYIFGGQYQAHRGNKVNKGIHDIHMNQGSLGEFEEFNGINQDGAILFREQDSAGNQTENWKGIFLAFASQAVSVDSNGNAIRGSKTLGDVNST